MHDPNPTHAQGLKSRRLPFWTGVAAILTVGLVVLGCTSGGGFPKPYADGEVLRSGLSIPPGETFVLGGGQPAGFIVQAFNHGDVPVELAVGPIPSPTDRGRIYPGSQSESAFEAGEVALLTNVSDRSTARLKVTITSLQPGQQLGMRYIRQ
ncbi:MAG: hypothetical protein AAGE65_09055 [Planctomycetota bacterium]